MSAEVWEQVYDRLAELINAHRTTTDLTPMDFNSLNEIQYNEAIRNAKPASKASRSPA